MYNNGREFTYDFGWKSWLLRWNRWEFFRGNKESVGAALGFEEIVAIFKWSLCVVAILLEAG